MRDKIIVDKMLRYANKVCEYGKGVSYEDFRANDMLIEACVFNLGQIGELTFCHKGFLLWIFRVEVEVHDTIRPLVDNK